MRTKYIYLFSDYKYLWWVFEYIYIYIHTVSTSTDLIFFPALCILKLKWILLKYFLIFFLQKVSIVYLIGRSFVKSIEFSNYIANNNAGNLKYIWKKEHHKIIVSIFLRNLRIKKKKVDMENIKRYDIDIKSVYIYIWWIWIIIKS